MFTTYNYKRDQSVTCRSWWSVCCLFKWTLTSCTYISFTLQVLQKRSRIQDWDQSSNLVLKKSRFCLQVPNFCLYLQMLLKRGGTQQSVIAVPYLDIYNVSCACIWYSLALSWESHIYWPLDIFWNGKCCDNACFCLFCNFMKITTKSPRKVQKWSQKSPDLVPKA